MNTLYEKLLKVYSINDSFFRSPVFVSGEDKIINFLKDLSMKKEYEDENIRRNKNILLEAYKNNPFIQMYFEEENVYFSNFFEAFFDFEFSKELFDSFKDLVPLTKIVEQAILEGKFSRKHFRKNKFKSYIFDGLEKVGYYSIPLISSLSTVPLTHTAGYDYFSLQTVLGLISGYFLGSYFFQDLSLKISDYFDRKNPFFYFNFGERIYLPLALERILFKSVVIEGLLLK